MRHTVTLIEKPLQRLSLLRHFPLKSTLGIVLQFLCACKIETDFYNARIILGDNLLTAVSVGRDCGIILPEQDVIAIQCVETPVPHIYYTYADVSPITSSINSPVVSSSVRFLNYKIIV